MLIINRPRQSGKTFELLKMMKADERIVFVAASHQSRDHARRVAESLDLNPNRIITVNEILHGNRWFSYDQSTLVVDELPELLQRLLHGPVVAATGSDFGFEPEIPFEEPAPEENFWDDRTTPMAYSRGDSERDMAQLRQIRALAVQRYPDLDGHNADGQQALREAFVAGAIELQKQMRNHD